MFIPADTPSEFLETVFEIDQLAAVRIANKWSASTDSERYCAAWDIQNKQTVLPKCEGCNWAIVDDDHSSCFTAKLASNEVDYDSFAEEIEDQYDEDPLAGDIDDGSHYVPGPNPLNTQHYHALKERGLL